MGKVDATTTSFCNLYFLDFVFVFDEDVDVTITSRGGSSTRRMNEGQSATKHIFIFSFRYICSNFLQENYHIQTRQQGG